jgi:hypothetical protein
MPEMSIEHEIAENVMQLTSLRGLIRAKQEELEQATHEEDRSRLQQELKELGNKEIALADYINQLRARKAP